ISLDKPHLLIGREPSCDICLPHPNVSRRHAQLQRTDEEHWLLQDLNSLNGVHFNDQPVQQIVLEPGQRVRIAEYHLVLLGLPSTQVMAALLAPALPPGDASDSTPSWPGLDPGWLEHLLTFQRALVRLDDPCEVLRGLAEAFRSLARPQAVAVGLKTAEG